MDGMTSGDATAAATDDWVVAGRRFTSRLVVGTGKYRDLEQTGAAIAASGAEIVTVAVRRVNLSDPNAPMLQDHVDPKRYTYLPNTAGCHTADDAVRTLRLAREAGGWNLVKLEVLGPPPHLYPDMQATLDAAAALLRDGVRRDGLLRRRSGGGAQAGRSGLLRHHAVGCADRIGAGAAESGDACRSCWIRRRCRCWVDAGVGTASDAALAMELGCDAVLLNSAIALAGDPIRMAAAMRHAVQAGRLAHRAGRMPRRMAADPSSPLGRPYSLKPCPERNRSSIDRPICGFRFN